MKSRWAVLYSFLVGSILLFAGILVAQNASERTLIVNGRTQGTAILVGGHSYVDVETVAQFTNGSVSFEQNRVVLNFPAQEAKPPAEAAPPPPPPGLSRNFASLALAELAELREWRGAVGTILTYGVPVVGSWPQDYHDRAETDLHQVEIAATTGDDHQAFLLLQNEFSNLASWADTVVSTRQSMNATNTVRPDTAANDPNLTKVAGCARFLNSMLVSGSFSDDPSCH